MIQYAPAIQLLAQVYREDLGRGFRGATAALSWHVLIPYIVAAVAIGVGIAVYMHVKKRNDMSEPCDDPQKLFRELCLVHRLDWRARNLIRRLAEAAKLSQPAQIFLAPEAFEPAELPPALARRAQEIARLRSKLF